MKRIDRLHSDIGTSTPDGIGVHGYDLVADLIGKATLGDMGFLMLKGRLPEPAEAAMFNAIAVTLVDHGVTPSVIAARMTYLGAPEALQAAVGAGLAGLGSVFVGSIEGAARLTQENADAAEPVEAAAARIAADFKDRGAPIPGIGHNLHKGGDPRAEKLFAVAADHGLSSRPIALMRAIAEAASERSGRFLPVNATGAIGAIASELGIPWRVARGIGVMARAIGLVGHLREEGERPMAFEIWQRVEAEAQTHADPKAEAAE